MAVGLYSGTSGLALGSGLYRDVAGLWGGASGLVNGFGIANTLPVAPAYASTALTPLAWFGQDSADRIATDSPDGTRRLTTPSGALLPPASAADWYCVMYATSGKELRSANYEVLASRASSSGAYLRVIDRAAASPAGLAWRWDMRLFNTVSRDLFTGLSPALTTQNTIQLGAGYCVVFGKAGNIPYMSIQRVGTETAHYAGAASSIAAFDSFYFSTAQYADGTVERSGGVLTYRKASIAAGYTAGATVLIQSTAQPSINGIYTIVSRLGSNAGFTVASAGADFGITAANASTQLTRSFAAGTNDLFKTLGGFETALVSDNYGWGGGVGPVEMRYGTPPISGGVIDPVWMSAVTNRRIAQADMPGVKRWRSDLDPAASYAADGDGQITGSATPIGTPVAAPMTGSDWLVIEPWDWHTPFASDMDPSGGTATGTARLNFTSAYVTGPLYAQVETSGGTVIVAEQQVSLGSSNLGSGSIVVPNIPNGMGYYLRIRAAKAGFTQVWGPFSVGPSFAWFSQSTINYLFSSATGTALTPITATAGFGTLGGVAGPLSAALTDGGTNPTNRAGWCRYSTYPIGFAGSAADGMKAFDNTLIELGNAQLSRAVPALSDNLCRSGHPASIFWADRRVFTNSIGTATAGVALTGTWQPQPLWVSAVTYCQASTAKVYRGGTYAQIGDANSEWRLTGGTLVATVDALGNWVAVSGSGVTGTFNINTGGYSVTDPVGGPLYIEAGMFFDTTDASTSGGRTGTGFTVWGEDNVYDTGQIDNLLQGMKTPTAFVFSWANYLLGYANARAQSLVDAQLAFDIAMLRTRINANYPQFAGIPWIIACDARTKSTSSIGEHRIRVAMRNYALATPDTYWAIGPITGDMDSATNSPHPGPLASSGQLWGITFGHSIAKACGIPGAKADEVYITSGTRGPGGAYVDLVFNVPVGASLTCADPTKIEGLYFAATDDTAAMISADNSTLDVYGGAYSTQIIGGNTVRVTPTSGSFAATTYWNCNVGFVLTDAVFATENTRLANTLSLDTGGYSSIRPGQPVSFCPSNVMVT